MPPAKELHLVFFQCGIIGVVNQAAEGRVYQDTIVQMRPLLLRLRMKKDAVLDAGHDQTLVPHIDSDHIANMNGLSVVVAHCQGAADCQARTPSLSPKASNVCKYSIAPERRTLTT
jgi:hypothetical protein